MPAMFNDAKKYGPHAELYFFLPRNMRCETDPIESGHVSIESLMFTFPFAQPEGLLLPAGDDPLSWGELGGLSWPRASGPCGLEAGPASFTRAGPARTGAFFPPDIQA